MDIDKMLAQAKAIWDAAPTEFLPGMGDYSIDEPVNESDRMPTDEECDRAADAYERDVLGL